jgi:hypothetical protein
MLFSGWKAFIAGSQKDREFIQCHRDDHRKRPTADRKPPHPHQMVATSPALDVQARKRWNRLFMLTENPTFEKHYRIGDLAKLWGLGRETVRKLVKDDPGVIKVRMGRKKAHTIYSVPESAARRIHTRLLSVA